MRKIALIGYGAIARIAMEKLREHDPEGRVKIVGLLVRPGREAETRAAVPPETKVVSSIGELLRLTPNLVAECAGQGAVAEYGEAVLRAGIDFMVISTGALADPGTLQRLTQAAATTGTHILMPAGAIAGIDGLAAHRIGGLTSVRYTSTKPPLAWRGTPAEEKFDLAAIAERTVLFTGPAS